MLPRQVAAWAKPIVKAPPNQPADDRTERAVRAVLTRWFVVEQVNNTLTWGKLSDELAQELLGDLAPWVLTARAGADRTARWLAHLVRLWSETITWEAASAEIARRYLGGRSPCVPEIAEQLARTREACAGLLTQHQPAVTRLRRPLSGEPIDLPDAARPPSVRQTTPWRSC